ncbi:glycerol-3-phosphate dehydrogenase [Thermoflexales bacterium]|nr:glycerol-3-phosphate dehydrogenase [Thermoflexales bacterium]
MWNGNWREQIWSDLAQAWDLIVIGGGITGAGILREASRAGLKTLLVEGHDFASGTSSRSSKLVHGGLRYLRNAQVKLTLDSVRERERLLREGRGLIEPLSFLIAGYLGDRPPAWIFGMGLLVYDVLGQHWAHQRYNAPKLQELCPQINAQDLVGGYHYYDAQTDDARLVLRVLREAVRAGGTAINYTRVAGLLRDRAGQVCGVQLQDQVTGAAKEVIAPVVISAVGAWADRLRAQLNEQPRLRPLRGSHLIIPWHKLPLTQAVNFLHPIDQRPVYAVPWEGITLIGTTDVDHGAEVQTDPRLTEQEFDYLMMGVLHAFKPAGLSLRDVQATFSGIRPVVNTGQTDPSKESRESVLWDENGLLTIAGGKLTTFRLMALQALRAVRSRLPHHPHFKTKQRLLDPNDTPLIAELDPGVALRLFGRYGADTPSLLEAAQSSELHSIAGAPSLWAELRWAAREEGVVHLDDLLLRRVRLGLLLPQGGLAYSQRIRAIAQPELGWSDERWEQELRDYTALWNRCYSVKV